MHSLQAFDTRRDDWGRGGGLEPELLLHRIRPRFEEQWTPRFDGIPADLGYLSPQSHVVPPKWFAYMRCVIGGHIDTTADTMHRWTVKLYLTVPPDTCAHSLQLHTTFTWYDDKYLAH